MIDVFYKIKSLYELGFQITLHCFEYNDREITEELKKYCDQIITYKRNYILKNYFHYAPTLHNNHVQYYVYEPT